MPGHKPSLVNMSLWQTPQACTLIRTCSGPGWGISRSTIWKSAPALGITATFIGATATLLVAICPPMLHRIVVEVHLLFSSMNVAIEKRQALSKIYSSLLRCVMGEDKVVRLNRLMRDPSALHSPAFAHVGSSVPTCSATMYLAYQSGQFGSAAPMRFSCSPWTAAARLNALARSFADAKVVLAGSTRPGSRVVISWNSHPLPSGSRNEANER